MNEDQIMNIGSEAIRTILYLSGPLLIAALVVGIIVSILQAVTQINEATLTFIPKMIAVIIILAVMGPWMLEVMREYTAHVIQSAGEVVK